MFFTDLSLARAEELDKALISLDGSVDISLQVSAQDPISVDFSSISISLLFLFSLVSGVGKGHGGLYKAATKEERRKKKAKC